MIKINFKQYNTQGEIMLKSLLIIGLLAFSAVSQANWTIDSKNSQVNFVSIKKSNIAEAHHFKTVSGKLVDDRQFQLTIDLSSVETGIEIRNQRMLAHLFIADKHANATLQAQLGADVIKNLTISNPVTHTLKASLLLNGVSKDIVVNVLVTKLNNDTILINSLKPVVINASDYMLSAGIDTLRDIAKLTNISYAVPVTFNLRLVRTSI